MREEEKENCVICGEEIEEFSLYYDRFGNSFCVECQQWAEED